MHLRKNCLVCVVFLTGIFICRPVYTAEPDQSEIKEDPCKIELAKLGAEYRRASREWYESLPVNDSATYTDSELSDEEWLNQDPAWADPSLDPDSQFIPRFLALAKKYPDSPYALDALAFVIYRGGPQTGNVLGEPWRTKERALDIVWRFHMDDPRVVHVFDILTGGIPSKKVEQFLRNALNKDSDRTTRAAAELCLARYLRTFDKTYNRSQRLKDKPRLVGPERFWEIVVTPYLEENFPYDHEQITSEIDQLLALVVEEYADVPAMDWKFIGSPRVFLVSKPYSQPKTYGDIAQSLLYELNHLVPGKQAPDIVGMDTKGTEFRLSDYEGKVVLLTFSADWCGGCVKLYPLQRNLIETFQDKPFVLLSVSMDKKIDTLQAATASGEIAWRCWWDGEYGPIYEAWNIHGAPSIFLLDDRRIIQDVRLSRITPQEEYESAITELLGKISTAEEEQ